MLWGIAYSISVSCVCVCVRTDPSVQPRDRTKKLHVHVHVTCTCAIKGLWHQKKHVTILTVHTNSSVGPQPTPRHTHSHRFTHSTIAYNINHPTSSNSDGDSRRTAHTHKSQRFGTRPNHPNHAHHSHPAVAHWRGEGRRAAPPRLYHKYSTRHRHSGLFGRWRLPFG